MLKKIAIIFNIFSMFITISINTHANNPWDPRNIKENPYDGAYMGINLGLDYSQNKVNAEHPSFYHNSHVSFNGYSGGLLLGYGKTLNEVYTGTEFSFHYIDSHGGATSHAVDNYAQIHRLHHTIRKNNDISISIRVGKLLDERFLIYTKFQGGIEDLTFTYLLEDGINHINKRINKKNPHAKLGVGADWLISSRLALGIGYDYKVPKKMTHNIENIKSQHTLDASILSFRIIYYF